MFFSESIIGFLFVATIVFGMGILMGMMVSTLITLKEPLNQSSDEWNWVLKLFFNSFLIIEFPF